MEIRAVSKFALSAAGRADEQRKLILDKLNADVLAQVELIGADVLVATYIEPEKTASGIYLPNQRTGESIYQGKAGLVLRVSQDAFLYRDGFSYFPKHPHEDEDDYEARVRRSTPKPGDWVIYRVTDAWNIQVNGVDCRIMPDSRIKGRVQDPDLIW